MKRKGKSIRRVAVLGAGVMGSQIAAHFVNAGIGAVLFELPAEGEDPRANARAAVDRLSRLKPAPFADEHLPTHILPASYETDLDLLGDCDLVIEAIAERRDWKTDLYRKVLPVLSDTAILATNTSGISIKALGSELPEDLNRRFCGIHFFNPPRYMHLVELIAGDRTDPRVMDRLESFLVRDIGKGVIRPRDTPNFVANRVGVFALVAVLHHAVKNAVPFDVADALTGPAIGRPKSATFRLMDIVGLDTLAYIVDSSRQALPDDPWNRFYANPDWLTGLIDSGALGRKTGAGVYRKESSQIKVLDTATGDYRPADGRPDAEVLEILSIGGAGDRLDALRRSGNPQASFLWSVQRDVFHYSAVQLESIADTARDLDLAMRWGYGWTRGPFEAWQAAGWQRVTDWISEDIKDGKAMAAVELPEWVTGIEAVHTASGSFCPAERAWKGRTSLPVYRRQLYPDKVLGEPAPEAGETLFENAGARLWTRSGDDVGILTFKSKMNTIGTAVLEGVNEALDIAEDSLSAVVIWQPKAPFCAGADLTELTSMLEADDFDAVERMVERFQATTKRMRYSSVPVVAAVQGMVLGGGCEFMLHCDRVVAALESYIGLVEMGVGLIPGGGGCKELALRAAQNSVGTDLSVRINKSFDTVATARVSDSALAARELGYLRQSDVVVLNHHELLYVAMVHARAMADSAYRPPLPRPILVRGVDGIADRKTMLSNMHAGGLISDYDQELGTHLAEALCGGEAAANSEVDEEWLLALERRIFVELAKKEQTRNRIAYTLKTGKPLRN